MKNLIFIFVFSVLSLCVFGQQEPIYTQSIFNKLSFNPGYAGSKGVTSFSSFARYQWLKVEGSPRTISVGVHRPLSFDNERLNRLNWGFSVVGDMLGDTKDVTGIPAIAYNIINKEEGRLSFGFHLPIRSMRTDLSNVQLIDVVDNITQQGNFVQTSVNIGAGLYYSSSNWFFGGSIPYLLPNTRTYLTRFFPEKTKHFYLTAGRLIDLPSRNWKLMVTGLLIKPTRAKPNFDITTSLIYQNKLWLGVNFRVNDSIDGIVQFQINEAFKIGMGYDYTVSSLQRFTNGSIELFLEYNLLSKASLHPHPRYPKAEEASRLFFN